MRKYDLGNGEKIQGRTYKEVVEQLRASGFQQTRGSLREFMEQVAKRVRIQTAVEIPTNNAQGFLRGLELAGLIKKEQ